MKLVVHPTCPSSRRVVMELYREGLLNLVDLIVAEDPWGAMGSSGGLVWSVPWFIGDKGEPLAADPIGEGESTRILRGEPVELGKDPLEAFLDAVLHSGYATVVALVHGSLSPLADPGFISAATRAPLTGVDVGELRRRILEGGEKLYSSIEDKLVRAAAVGFARDLYWALGRRLDAEELKAHASPGAIAAWLLAKASIGRIGLPRTPSKPEPADAIAGFIARTAAGLARRVSREQEEIASDKVFNELLAEHAKR